MNDVLLFWNIFVCRNKIRELINSSKPVHVKRVNVSIVSIINSDFNISSGEFVFLIKNDKEEKIRIPFCYKNRINLNTFIRYLEDIVDTVYPVPLIIISGIEEVIIYFEPIKKLSARFTILSYQNKEKRYVVVLDVIMKKKELISQMYKKIADMFKDYTITSCFEPPIIDCNRQIKLSPKIEKYLGGAGADGRGG